MPFAGPQLMPRVFAKYAAKHWGGIGLIKAVATAHSESQLYVGAWHDNLDANGKVVSRDCGIFQINIPASQIGTPAEAALRTESTDPAIWVPVVENSVEAALKLYDQPWTRDGKPDLRKWEPWYGYTLGYATWAEWWVFHQEPAPPHWFYTGRHVQKAIPGVANYHLLIAADWSGEEALAFAKKMQGVFRIEGTLKLTDKGVTWGSFPAEPTAPPADGVGPKPTPNDGA